MPIVRIKNTGLMKGEISFVSLDMFLEGPDTPSKGYSKTGYTQKDLDENAEVQNYVSRKAIVLVPEAEFAKAIAEQEAAVAAPPTIEDAIEEDSPQTAHFQKLLDKVKQGLNDLESAMQQDADQRAERSTKERMADPEVPEAPERTTAPAADVNPKDLPKEDDIGLPINPPPGLKPQVPTVTYLRLDSKGKKKFLKECWDIGILRDVALHEPDKKIKTAARKKVKQATAKAEGAAA